MWSNAELHNLMSNLYSSAAITAHLVDSNWSPTPEMGPISGIPSASIQASQNLSGVTVVDGYLRANDTDFEGATGNAVAWIVLERAGNIIGAINDFGEGPGQIQIMLNGTLVTIVWSDNPGICGLRQP